MAHDLVSLITVVDGILQQDQVLDDHKKALFESLLGKVTSLKDLLEKSVVQHLLKGNKEIIQGLLSEISGAAHEAEDIIESHVAEDLVESLAEDQWLSEPEATRFGIEKGLLKSILEKVTSFKTTMQRHLRCNNCCTSSRSNKGIIQELQSEICEAAHNVEDITESHAVDKMLFEPSDNFISNVMEKFDAANDKLTKILINKEDYHHQSRHDERVETTTDVISDPTSSKTHIDLMVGFEEDALHLKHRLTSQRRVREIVPIVGMGGIGKTTLARNLYNDTLVVSHFDARAWVTVSQNYNVRSILLCLLGCLFGNLSEDVLRQNYIELGITLYQRLCGRRYLVVLDDIWNGKDWDEMKHCFPNQNNGSRILITSRELHVAKHADSACEEHQMRLLSDGQGWDLLRQKVFGSKGDGPHFLQEIGRKIASNCGGLPLAISVIGGLLSVEKHSKDLWDKVATDVRSITDNHISEILCLSYDNLPLHLKPCFLYMSAFPEDYEVRRSKLVKLLVAEGFLWRSSREDHKSFEDIAEEYLNALVDRSLLSVTSTKYNGRTESYGMHDLLRDLCVRKAYEENFLCIIGKHQNVNNFRRVSVHQFTEDATVLADDLSGSRSLFYISPKYFWINISSIVSALRLMRVLDVYDISLNDFPEEILKLAYLRFLAVNFMGFLPLALWRLRNLQTLLVNIHSTDQDEILPREAWENSGLRHIKLNGTPIHIDFKIRHVHKNLQTICYVLVGDLLSSNLIINIPNIIELGIAGYRFYIETRVIDLSHLHKLESLKLNHFSASVHSLLKLPNCLKKLSLYRCTLPRGFGNNGLDDLQQLEVLKIKHCHFQSVEHSEEEEEKEWELNEGVEFCSLQFLELFFLDIVHWKADSSHFPMLRHLKIQHCIDLKEIPTCIGEISTLELIEVNEDMDSHVDWAYEVWDTQRDEYGNESLQIRLT